MSSEVKNTIGLLCKLLNLLYETNLKPEYFRLAKFNKTDENVVPALWNLLAKLVNEDDTNNVKQKLQDLDYRRNQFYLSTETHVQSRELLLAVGFLILLHLEDTVNSKLKNLAFSDDSDSFKNYQSFSHNMANGYQQFNWKKLNPNDLNNYKKWICGKMYYNRSTIKEYQEHISKMQDKFNKTLDIKADGRLTVHEILALKNKAIGEQFIRDTEPVLNILSVYSEWLKKEKHFWKWMESVLLEDKK